MAEQIAGPTHEPSSPRSTRQEYEPWYDSHEFSIHLKTGDLAALAPLRRLARAALTVWDVTADQADDVLLVLSELATNALVHTDGPAYVRLERRGSQVLLQVTDSDTTDLDLGPAPEPEAEHGYGLACIAAAYADEFDVIAQPHGKTVSAAFTLRS